MNCSAELIFTKDTMKYLAKWIPASARMTEYDMRNNIVIPAQEAVEKLSNGFPRSRE